jgi:conjugal transfer/entry exclusion protein
MKLTYTALFSGALAATALSASAFPVVGGLPVFDGAAFGEMIVQTSKIVTQINQMIKTYNRITQQYDHMVHQAKYIGNLYRYHAPSTIWRGLSGTDTYGTSGRWIKALNSGLDTLQGWESATVRTVAYPSGLAGIPASQRQRKQTDFATVELQDGTAVSAMDTIGRIRLKGPRVESALALLDSDSLSSNPDMHTEAAQLNKANAIALIQTKALTDQNKLLVSTAEIGLVRLKQERDAAAYALANDVAFRTDGKNALDAQHGNASNAMLAYRLP